MAISRSLIFLIGYRATGKTTVARLLADRISWNWVDADQIIETRHGQTIRQIFADEGEAGFRAKEWRILDELCLLKQHVVATGGGVVLRPASRELLRESGLVVWLTADPETIWQRLQADPSTFERRRCLRPGRSSLSHSCASGHEIEPDRCRPVRRLSEKLGVARVMT